MTDAGLFERLATAVLRSSCPELYGNLGHPGVNSQGKTIKAPLDNIGWIREANCERVVAAAHSTCEASDLRGKWLHDPGTAKSRKPGRKPTAREGDLRKAIREINAFRKNRPALRATLALTSNREPGQEVRVAAQKLAADAGIELDIWSGSRIGDHLDNNPQGQWLRRTHLGAPVQLVSAALIRNYATQMVADRFGPVSQEETIERRGPAHSSTAHALLVGPSGIGKTTVALQMLQAHLSTGGYGLVLSHEALSAAASLSEALEIELRKLEPTLQAHCGAAALTLGSETLPFWVLVEDANRGDDPAMLFNKVLGWAANAPGASRAVGHWRLICPIWPRHLDSIEAQLIANKGLLLHSVSTYSQIEAATAVDRRASAMGLRLLPGEISAIAESLGRDPLLIGLHDFSDSPDATTTVGRYIDHELAKVAAAAPDLMTSELRQAVTDLVAQMLDRRTLSPSWKEIRAWFSGEPTQIQALRLVFKAGSVMRLHRRGSDETLTPRHDRVLLSLMSRVAARALNQGRCEVDYLADPFFSEAVGFAAVDAGLDRDGLWHLLQKNPLALFHAFERAVRSNKDSRAIKETLQTWLEDGATHGRRYRSVRLLGLRVLAQIDAQDVLQLSDLFRDEDRNDNWCQARFRNGDISAGLRLLTMYRFGMSIAGRRELLRHVFARYGSGITQALREILERPELDARSRTGALYMAGYLGDPSLAPAIRARWQMDGAGKRDLRAYLWAAARCHDCDPDSTLRAVCDEWERMPDGNDAESKGQSRGDLAAHEISWEFRDFVPVAAIPYFVQRAQSEDLAWPITYMLRCIDHPAAADHIVRYIARREESFIASHFLLNEWRRRQEERGIGMSEATKQHLLSLALDESNTPASRRAAFGAWEQTSSARDLEDIRPVVAGNLLYSKALWARVRRADSSVIPELLAVLPSNPQFWWQAGCYLWSSEMTQALHLGVLEFASTAQGSTVPPGELDWTLSERLMELDGPTAENILIESWDALKTSPRFIQAAAFHCSPRLIRLVESAIAEAPDPKILLEHVTSHMGWKTSGRKGIRNIKQAELLAKHADLLDAGDLSALWDLCNERGWTDLRRRYLDARIAEVGEMAKRSHAGVDLSDLDKAFEGTGNAWSWLVVDDHVRRGVELGVLMDAVFSWLKSHKSIVGLRLVADILDVTGRRTDVDRLRAYAVAWEVEQEAMEDLAFSVRSRILR